MASLLHSKAGCIHESWQNLPSQIAKETEAERVGDLPKPSVLKPGSFSSALSRPYHINVYLFSLSFFFYWRTICFTMCWFLPYINVN